MKKIFITLVAGMMLFSTSLLAQEKIGVETTAPTESMDVNGTMRVRDLPIDGTGAIYNGANTKSTTFTATKTIVADDNGNLGVVNGTPQEEPFNIENTTNQATSNTQNVYQNGRVGVGDFSTSSIENALHVKSTQNPLRLEGLQGSTESSDKVLVVDQNGVVKTDISSATEFVGFLSTNQSLYGQTIQKINVADVLYDAGSEFTVTNNYFTPKETGVYRIEITITSYSYRNNGGGSYSYPTYSGAEAERAVLGLAQQGANGATWVSRLAFNASSDQRAISFIASANLVAGQRYFFGISGAQDFPGIYLYANPTGSSGAGRGTYFGISRID